MKFLSACLLGALALSACAKKSPEGTAAPDAGGAVPDDITALEQELDLREQQLAAVGAAPTTPALAGGGGGGQAAQTRIESEKKAPAAGGDAAEAQSIPAPTSAPAEPAPYRDVPQDRCTTVCELSASICQLQDRICDLAPRHPGEPRYQAACDRAARDCESSREACHACA